MRLVVRVRNVGKETVKFSYPQPLIEHPLTVTDHEGKPVFQPNGTRVGAAQPNEISPKDISDMGKSDIEELKPITVELPPEKKSLYTN